MPELERRWGNILAARRYRLVVEAIGHVWPEAFAVAPPCCPRVSHDEALLAAMVGAAGAGNRANFDWLTAEMLGGDAREMLFVALGNFLRARAPGRSEEHTSELQSLMRISYAVFCLKKKNVTIVTTL